MRTSQIRHRSLARAANYLAAAVVVLAAAPGCSNEAPPYDATDPRTQRTADDYPMVWIENPALDLTSSDGTFIRGFLESWLLSVRIGKKGNFPGFSTAYGESLTISLNYGPFYSEPFVSYLWPAPYTDLSSLEERSEPASRPVGVAVVCMTTDPLENQGYEFSFTYERSGRLPVSHQAGPRSTPRSKIFGDWKLIELLSPSKERQKRCESLPRPFPFNVRKSTPGWPA
ncbi:hypothetical protein M2359_000601 [Gordonia amarae]|nr:hypothetical protein [Gordonia amarae]